MKERNIANWEEFDFARLRLGAYSRSDVFFCVIKTSVVAPSLLMGRRRIVARPLERGVVVSTASVLCNVAPTVPRTWWCCCLLSARLGEVPLQWGPRPDQRFYLEVSPQ